MGGFTRPRRFAQIMVFVMAFCAYARAVNLTVNCNGTGALSTINGALKVLNAPGPNTLTVSGNCKENIVIQSLDRLTLITKNSASITDVSNGNLPVIDIEDSRSVRVQGFKISGGYSGIACSSASTCYLTGNTVEAALGQEGIGLFDGANAFLDSNTIQNNTQRGMTVANGARAFSSGDIVEGNTSHGVVVNSGGYLNANICTIQNNGTDGILVTNRSTLRLISCTISKNGRDGVFLRGDGEAQFNAYDGPTTISGNGRNGVTVRDLSYAQFDPITVTGNLSGTDVLCAPQYPATRGALTNLGGGSTNCVEP